MESARNGRSRASARITAAGLGLLVTVMGCSGVDRAVVASSETDVDRQGRIFAATCAHCHVGRAGAPRAGVAADWNTREVRDFDVLVARSLTGFGDMPPLGTCSFCTEADMRGLIALMVAGSEIVVPDGEEGR